MTSSREKAAEVRAEIIDEFYSGRSYADLAESYGYDVSTIAKMVARYRRDNPDRQRTARPKDPRPYAVKRSLSQTHFRIGLAISLYRAEHGLNPTQFGHLLAEKTQGGGKSRCKIRDMEIGAHDFTLTEVHHLADILDIPYETLVFTKAARVA